MSKTPEQYEKIKVVIIEDYKLTRVGLRSTLNEFGNILVAGEAENAEDGLVVINKVKPDIVLMDIGLPGMNGIDATFELKLTYPEIKIIILTSHDREEEIFASLSAGASAYCMKDIAPATLATVIENVSKGCCWLDPSVAEIALKLLTHPEMSRLSGNCANINLTERELEVLQLLVDGKTNPEIATLLSISEHTAKAHVSKILQKFKVNDRVQAAVKALRQGIVI